jgi:hypothetical protein
MVRPAASGVTTRPTTSSPGRPRYLRHPVSQRGRLWATCERVEPVLRPLAHILRYQPTLGAAQLSGRVAGQRGSHLAAHLPAPAQLRPAEGVACYAMLCYAMICYAITASHAGAVVWCAAEEAV